MRPNTSTVLEATISSAASTYTSSTIFGWDIVRCSYQVIGSGSFVGTFKLQGSNQKPVGSKPQLNFTPTAWNDLASSSAIVASTTASVKNYIIPPQEVCYSYYQIVFTDASAGAAPGQFEVRFNSLGF